MRIITSESATPAPQPLDPEVVAKIASLRSHVRESFGKVVMAMMVLPRYRHQTLADLQHLVLEPLIRDRVAIAQRGNDKVLADDIAGVAIWASVSEECDARIRDQIKGGTWPIRLRSEDWNSGSINWLIDVIAPDQKSTAGGLPISKRRDDRFQIGRTFLARCGGRRTLRNRPPIPTLHPLRFSHSADACG